VTDVLDCTSGRFRGPRYFSETPALKGNGRTANGSRKDREVAGFSATVGMLSRPRHADFSP